MELVPVLVIRKLSVKSGLVFFKIAARPCRRIGFSVDPKAQPPKRPPSLPYSGPPRNYAGNL